MIRYAFLHLDGVVLENVLAPITHAMVLSLGGKYSAEIEDNIFAQSQIHGARFLISHLKLGKSVEEVIELYYEERRRFEAANVIRPNPGLQNFLALLKSLNYKVACYGGAPREYFLKNASEFVHFFNDDAYIQTKDIRPGVKEIIRDIYGIEFREALFVDDEVTVARAARTHGVPFIGMPNHHSFSFQRVGMQKEGIKYVVDSLAEIHEGLLSRIQRDCVEESVW